MKRGDTYICENCHGEFQTGWSGEEASQEFSERFETSDVNEAAIVCDDCYKILMGDDV